MKDLSTMQKSNSMQLAAAEPGAGFVYPGYNVQ
jgi:hypothetical protein